MQEDDLMRDEISTIIEGLKKLFIPDFENVAKKMYRFMQLVLERNELINLTTITETDEFIERHLLDSVVCYGWAEIEKANLIVDVGTGSGIPGIPLALCYPDKKFLLIDSLGKRIDFINEVIDDLQITNVQAIHARAEDAGKDATIRESFDLCVSRAVAPLNVLLEYCLPLIKPQGAFYAYKTVKAKSEIEDSELALRLLGASLDVQTRTYGKNWEQNDPDVRFSNDSPYSLCIFVVSKQSSTPLTYPRKAGRPKKVPL